jgi:hypothetical protein
MHINLSSVKQLVTAVLIALSAVGCTGPLPEGKLLDSDGAVDAVFRVYKRVGDRPRVWGVESDGCSPNGYAFVDSLSGVCVGAFTDGKGGDIYMALGPGMKWSESPLAHEAIHHLDIDDHPTGGTWDDASPTGQKILAAKAALRALPEVDAIREMVQ